MKKFTFFKISKYSTVKMENLAIEVVDIYIGDRTKKNVSRHNIGYNFNRKFQIDIEFTNILRLHMATWMLQIWCE